MLKRIQLLIVGICGAVILLLSTSVTIRSAVSELSGLAVAQTPTSWNNVRDAVAGDNLTAGVLASQLYFFDGLNFDRLRGSVANGILVDVTRMPGGAFTPSDNFVNPTGIQGNEVFNMIFDGTNWSRQGSASADGLSGVRVTASALMWFNGTTWDRLRLIADNSVNPSGKLGVLPCIASQPTVNQTWTAGNIVPCVTNVNGNAFVQQRGILESVLGAVTSYPTQALNLFNSQTTGAVNTSVIVTIPAATNQRAMLSSIEAQCSAGSSTITIQDGTTTIFTSMGANVPAAPGTYRREWSVPLTGSTNTTMTITLAACGVGNTGTLHVQAARV